MDLRRLRMFCWMLQAFTSNRLATSFFPQRYTFGRAVHATNMTAKKESPSADRNKYPIWEILESNVLPTLTSHTLRVVEIAAGAGVHSVYFSSKLLELNKVFHWTPTDPDQTSLASIDEYINEQESIKEFVARPLQVTLDANGIQEQSARSCLQPMSINLMIAINLIHISPWAATIGLMKTAGILLSSGGKLYLYGPYRENGTCVESNLRFEDWLKSLDPSYGVRNLEDVIEAASAEGLDFVEKIDMPANNLSVLFQKK